MSAPVHQPSSLQRERITQFMTHLICIGILFILPEVLMVLTTPSGQIPWGFYAKSLVFIGVFYVNYFFVIDQWAGRNRNIGRFIAYNLILIAASLLLTYLISRYGIRLPHKEGNIPVSKVIGFLSRDLAMTVLTMGLSVALKLSDRWQRLEQRRQTLAADHREQELQQLKSQLNPHFLFNSLNTIYALIAISPDQAQNAVHTLSRLLRYALYDSSDTVTLRQEIDFINDYIQLMSLRIGNRPGLAVTLDSGSHDDMRIPPMLFITLVENVFKHGNTGHVDDIFQITLTVDESTLYFRTKNRFDSTKEQSSASGIGIANIRRRLRLLYHGHATLDCHADGDIYTVEMTIKLSQ